MRYYFIAITCFLLFVSTTHAGLPPEIQADQYMTACKKYVQEKDWVNAEKYFNKIKALNIQMPPSYYYQFGKVLYELKKHEPALANFELYLTKAGKTGEHYREALRIYTDIEEKIKEQKRAAMQKQAAEQRKKDAELAKQKSNYEIVKYKIEILGQIIDLLPKKFKVQVSERPTEIDPCELVEIDYDLSYELKLEQGLLTISGSGTADSGIRFPAFFGGYNDREHKKHHTFDVKPCKILIDTIFLDYKRSDYGGRLNGWITAVRFDVSWINGMPQKKGLPWDEYEYIGARDRTTSFDYINPFHIYKEDNDFWIIIPLDNTLIKKNRLKTLIDDYNGSVSRNRYGLSSYGLSVDEYNAYIKYRNNHIKF